MALVFYTVLTSKGYLSHYDQYHPQEPLRYSVYIWSGLFYYALQGLWMLAAFTLGLGGLAREKANGTALFTLGLPVRRSSVFLVRAAIASIEAILLAVISAMLIPLLSSLVGEYYPASQALVFGLLMGIAGLIFLTLGLLLSELFEAEFTAPVVGLCVIATVFLSYKAHQLHVWNVFDVMSGAAFIDRSTQLLTGGVPWRGLCTAIALSLGLLCATVSVVRAREC